MPPWPYDRAWERYRAGKLSREPLCAWCGAKGVVEAAVVVHHVIPVQSQPRLRLSDDNTVSLCKRCHDVDGALSDEAFWKSDRQARRDRARCNDDGTPRGEHPWNDEDE